VKRAAAGFALGLAVGAGLAWLALGPDRDGDGARQRAPRAAEGQSAPRAAGGAASLSEETRRLRAELALEREMRERLADELALLAPGGAPAEHEGGHSEDVPTPRASDARPPRAGHESAPDKGWFDAARLEALGLDPRRIERIRAGWEAYTMEKLYLTDAQARGETLTKHQRALRHQQIEVQLREDLGDADYEAVLYATAQRNRIVLTDVLETSPAAAAGIQSGDEVLSYDGERIFRPGGLKLMTFAGEPGELVEVRLLRDGELRRVFVARGPLGVRYSAESRAPYLD
jgi:hypothetical protein